MNDEGFAIMTAVLGASCLLAAFLGHRAGNEKRDVRLMAGGGAALGGIALVVFALIRI